MRIRHRRSRTAREVRTARTGVRTGVRTGTVRTRVGRTAAALAGAALLTGAAACSDEAVFDSQVSDESDPAAAGISVPADASLFRTSATGPDLLNPSAPEGSAMSFVDPVLLDADGKLPAGMTVTEAQSLQVLSKIESLLTDRKLKLYEVGTVRAYLSPDGRNGTDFDGWNRAYRRYFANIDRITGRSLVEEPTETTAATTAMPTSTSASSPASPDAAADAGTGTPAAAPTTTRAPGRTTTSGPATTSREPSAGDAEPGEPTGPYPGTTNRTRPTLVTVGVAQQPVKGWLVQVEIEVVHGED